jgi:sec-independent protein translocase protein TatA
VFRQIGAPEIILILAVVVLLFGATKLPELARGSGRALRIFKAETKGLMDNDDDKATPEQREIDARNRSETPSQDRSQATSDADTEAQSQHRNLAD